MSIRAPAAAGRVVRSGLTGDRVPSLGSRGRSMVLSHVERFATVKTTGDGFQRSSYFVNPGLPSCFPWLADVAIRFEKYKFSDLRFRYVPQSAAQAGLVTLAFDFDPEDDEPDTMAEATTYHDYVSTSIWHEGPLKVDLANGDRLPQKNVRAGMPGGQPDLNLYDVGRLHVCTEGAVAGVVGYVEVMYTVTLFIHQTQAGVGGLAKSLAGLDATHTVGTDFLVDAQAQLPVIWKDSNTLEFIQPFEGLVTLRIEGTELNGPLTYSGTLDAVDFVGAITGGTPATRVIVSVHLRAATGQTMSFVPTSAATVTLAEWRFAKARYRALV